jgi:hypothetical protein
MYEVRMWTWKKEWRVQLQHQGGTSRVLKDNEEESRKGQRGPIACLRLNPRILRVAALDPNWVPAEALIWSGCFFPALHDLVNAPTHG